ncbi:MAG: hypothetical protein IIX97_04215 [Clostridia bacterium]|nr:hypothetical protein [Clostridia bacterium]
MIYGDGIHDDTLGIQELIDSGVCEVSLPAPKKFYIISKPLELPSNFRLVLPRFAEIRLAKGSNCLMLKNKTTKREDHVPRVGLWEQLLSYSPDHPCENIEVRGGIWNFNNLEQLPNPIQTKNFGDGDYCGFGFLFYNVKGLVISSLTLKDPVNFAVTLDTVSYFTVEDIIFDFNYGNPLACNMDGIHIDGNCHFGHIRNLKGACYDDLVALNADEGTNGPISHIDINGIYAEDCHSALRMLTVQNKVSHVHVSNVHGTYFQYCIGLTKYFKGETKGEYDSITLDNIYASKAKRLPVYNKKPTSYVYPLIYIEEDTRIKNIKISDLHRREELIPIPTVFIGEESRIDSLILENITTENLTEDPQMPVLDNRGKIGRLYASNIRADGKEVILSAEE